MNKPPKSTATTVLIESLATIWTNLVWKVLLAGGTAALVDLHPVILGVGTVLLASETLLITGGAVILLLGVAVALVDRL